MEYLSHVWNNDAVTHTQAFNPYPKWNLSNHWYVINRLQTMPLSPSLSLSFPLSPSLSFLFHSLFIQAFSSQPCIISPYFLILPAANYLYNNRCIGPSFKDPHFLVCWHFYLFLSICKCQMLTPALWPVSHDFWRLQIQFPAHPFCRINPETTRAIHRHYSIPPLEQNK